MVKHPKRKEGKPKESEFKKFAKKRAPIYLAVAALVVVFVVPELTKSDLQSHFPEDLAPEERQVLDTLMSYKGPDREGLSLMEALSEKIGEEYPDEKIYDNKRTAVDIQIIKAENGTHRVLLDFESHKGKLDYSWDVDTDTGDVKGNNPKSKHIVDVVYFFD